RIVFGLTLSNRSACSNVTKRRSPAANKAEESPIRAPGGPDGPLPLVWSALKRGSRSALPAAFLTALAAGVAITGNLPPPHAMPGRVRGEHAHESNEGGAVERVEELITLGWTLYTGKVAGKLLSPENEKMMQLHLAQIFQTLAPLFEREPA